MIEKLRKVALCLHGLDNKDRQWILKSLPKRFGPRIQTMLQELESLGIPKDREWTEVNIEKLLKEISEEKANKVVFPQVYAIDKLDVSEIKVVLDSMPVNVVAGVLSVHTWSWKQPFLAKCPSSKRQYLNQEAQRIRGKLPRKVINAVLNVVISKIPHEVLRTLSSEELLKLNNINSISESKWSTIWRQ